MLKLRHSREKQKKHCQLGICLLHAKWDCIISEIEYFSHAHVSESHCSRVTCYNSFISQDLFHFPMLIHDGDTLNSPLNLKINGRILKNSNFFTYWKFFSEIYVLIYKTVAILIKLGINIVRICKESQHWSKNLWIKPD